jgi:hypothetical protein
VSLHATEDECAAIAVAPRVSLADIEAAIAARYDITAADAVKGMPQHFKRQEAVHTSLDILSICILVMRNGFTIIGKSAPASTANFNADLGKKLAYEDAIRQLWPLMGFALRNKLSESD